jgi:hypothetical protein
MSSKVVKPDVFKPRTRIRAVLSATLMFTVFYEKKKKKVILFERKHHWSWQSAEDWNHQ